MICRAPRTVVFALLLASAGLLAQQPASPPPAGQPSDDQQPLPRFRGGANLVRVDAYVMQDGKPVTDLTAADFEVIEDSATQRVESFEMIRPRGPAPQAVRVEPNTVADSRAMATDP